MTQTPSKQSSEDADNFIYPKVRHPYYIVAPPYIRQSAGVRVLHLLCHSLNRLGHTAYMVICNSRPWRGDQVDVDLLTPILTPHIARNHHARGLTPIMVYPETITGNPYGAPCVVRYVLNFPGLLGGTKEYPADELCFGYSAVLAEAAKAAGNVLFLPATDTRVFYPEPSTQKRVGSCFYAYKYKTVHKGELSSVTSNSVEITRDQPGSQTPEEIAALFRRSAFFYTYENTALATEAVLCGCPAVFLPNPHLEDIIAKKELGQEGYAWGTAPEELARAQATVGQGMANYLKTYDVYWQDLNRFIALTQRHVEGKAYPKPVYVPGAWDTVREIIKKEGILGLIRAVLGKLMRICLTRKMS